MMHNTVANKRIEIVIDVQGCIILLMKSILKGMPSDLIIFGVTTAVSLAVMLIVQPKQGHESNKKGSGISFIIHTTDDQCYHIHHWCIALLFFLMGAVVYAMTKRDAHRMLAGLSGLLLGLMLSDLAYTDFLQFSIRCRICPMANRECPVFPVTVSPCPKPSMV